MHLGIDPGRSTGLAAWNDELEIWPAKGFWYAYSRVCNIAEMHSELTIWIEDPNENKPVFWRGKSGQQNLRIAQNVGMNKRDAQLWIALCEDRGWDYRTVTPTTSKWTKEYFRRVTGYEGRVSQHAIDAAKLVFGR